MELMPIVTAIIPTRNRPHLVERAVRSALQQTFTQIEVLVVIDGPDLDTENCLASIQDSRLRIILLTTSRGGSGARNAGVLAARGAWVAFLDDDDEWLPEKIKRQMELAVCSSYKFPVVSCSIVARMPSGDCVRPRNIPSNDHPLSEYLICQTFSDGPGLLITTTLLVRRDLLVDVPFRAIKKYQDWDWILRASQVHGFGIEFVRDPLAIWDMAQDRPRVSTVSDWTFSLDWLRSNRAFLTDRAYAGGLLTLVHPYANTATFRERLSMISEAFASGRPRLMDIIFCLRVWLIPSFVRRRFRALLVAARR